MGIVLVRVDDRLVHGQIIEAWAPFYEATCIIVASDEAKKNRIQRTAIESCSSNALAIKVFGIEEAVRYAASDGINKETIIIIFSTLKELAQAYGKGFKAAHVNIGNIHHNGKVRMITQSVYIDKEDEGVLQNFLKLGIELDIRAVPSDKKTVVSF